MQCWTPLLHIFRTYTWSLDSCRPTGQCFTLTTLATSGHCLFQLLKNIPLEWWTNSRQSLESVEATYLCPPAASDSAEVLATGKINAEAKGQYKVAPSPIRIFFYSSLSQLREQKRGLNWERERGHTGEQADRQRQTETDRDRQRERERERQTDRQTDRQRETEKDRQGERKTLKKKKGWMHPVELVVMILRTARSVRKGLREACRLSLHTNRLQLQV